MDLTDPGYMEAKKKEDMLEKEKDIYGEQLYCWC